jgi:hypothetical protein
MRRLTRKIRLPKKSTNVFLPLVSLFCIILLFSSSSFYQDNWSFNWDEIRIEVKDSILIYERHPITSGVAGEGVSTAPEVKTRLWIMNYATIHELLLLKNYPDGTIKAIAFEGLIRKRDFSNKKEIILEAINYNKVKSASDNEHIVAYQSGCLVFDLSLGEYLVIDVLHLDKSYPTPPSSSRLDIGLSDTDKQEILEAYGKIKSN